MEPDKLLQLMVDKGASHLHVRVPSPPVFCIEGKLVVEEEFPPLTPGDIESIFKQIASEQQRKTFYKELELNFAYSVSGLGRFVSMPSCREAR